MSKKRWLLSAEAASGYSGPEMPLFLLASPVTSQRALVAFKSKAQMVLGLPSFLCLLAKLQPRLLLRELVLFCSRERKMNKIWTSQGRVTDVPISSLMHHVWHLVHFFVLCCCLSPAIGSRSDPGHREVRGKKHMDACGQENVHWAGLAMLALLVVHGCCESWSTWAHLHVSVWV